MSVANMAADPRPSEVLAKKDKSSFQKLMGSSLKMASATFLSRILGLIRDQVMAKMFGASGLTDAFVVAYRIPNLLRDLFAEGAFSSAFVPTFTEARLKSPETARRLLWSLFVILAAITSIFTLLIIIFAPEITAIFAPEFKSDPEKFQITVSLVRIMAPFLVFISLAALFMGVLNSIKIFFIPSLAPAFFNVVMISSMLLLSPYLVSHGHNRVFSMGIGVLAGGFVQLLVQLPLIFIKSYGPKGPLEFVSDYTKRIINRLGIGTIGIAATHINVLVTTIIATSTVVGAVSWLNYAFRLFQLPIGILSVSIAGSTLVHFSDAWKKKDFDHSRELLASSYFLSLLVIAPALVLMYVLSFPTVNIIFERGAFIRHDTEMTALAMQYYALGLPFYGLFKIFVPTFYVFDRPQIPVAISITTIIINIIFCLLLTPVYGFRVLAIGTTLSMAINSLAQAFFLSRQINLSLSFFINRRVFKIIFAGFIAYMVCRLSIDRFFSAEYGLFRKVLLYSSCVVVTITSYIIPLALLGEFGPLKKLVSKRVA
ncbi:MAG: murein biosynthesis integral membrane protein MurJ [Bdellovibrionales bacterium RIFOXYD12_FULL_39_22]|nr:MAG: murein biosynthesis integral membrane protein MurJ [Bdellovibrionales bacterium RIFOXYB1_FULL_39_21]OFZ44990.1 MAG: murein biosynthesis integral membrane protein MurJ [Bdellovibrionales bacterium RIFOXYC12_FULL_39_17]OFZ49428.1 MAG: murein biosynthesis integral membrane protein MurJ [Bdellovibrionales bacterium RIFOXYC1_FULL_39_130]OFZ77167.1 MAG: murein biosynthesis integral membrane protein MurJ [Bdellovibrionales bacterium RIFOXYD1_FULL_39_84]OFZ95612.1 MAG: murein biosynthesis integ